MKKHDLIAFLILLAFIYPVVVIAQSTGEAPSDPSGGVPPSDPAPSSTTSDPTPVTDPAPVGSATPAPAAGASPRPVPGATPIPAIVSSPGFEAVPDAFTLETNTEPLPPSPSSGFPFALPMILFGISMALGAVAGVLKANKSNINKKNCADIKNQLDQKNIELKASEKSFSLQEAIFEEIKEKIAEKKDQIKSAAIDKAKEFFKDSVLELEKDGLTRKTIETAEKVKEEYDNLSEKYEKGKELLEALKIKKDGLARETLSLQKTYKICMLGTSTANAISVADKLNLELVAPTKKAYTLCHVFKDNKILLGMKKHGFGEGRWNGFGGKVEEGEKIEAAAMRELREEIGLDAKKWDKIGVLDFSFTEDPKQLEVHIFKVTDYLGEPVESDEMEPGWFDFEEIPYEQMWAGDKKWFPMVLRDIPFEGNIVFDRPSDKEYSAKVISCNIKRLL